MHKCGLGPNSIRPLQLHTIKQREREREREMMREQTI